MTINFNTNNNNRPLTVNLISNNNNQVVTVNINSNNNNSSGSSSSTLQTHHYSLCLPNNDLIEDHRYASTVQKINEGKFAEAFAHLQQYAHCPVNNDLKKMAQYCNKHQKIYETAKANLNLGKYEEARVGFSQLIQLHPANPEFADSFKLCNFSIYNSSKQYIFSCLYHRDYQNAFAAVRQHFATYGEDAEVQTALRQSQDRESNPDEVIESINKVIRCFNDRAFMSASLAAKTHIERFGRDPQVEFVFGQCQVIMMKQSMLEEFNSQNYPAALDLAEKYLSTYQKDEQVSCVQEKCQFAIMKQSIVQQFSVFNYKIALEQSKLFLSKHPNDSEILQIRQKCEVALEKETVQKELKSGNHLETLRLAKDFCSKYPNDPEISRVMQQCQNEMDKQAITQALNAGNYQKASQLANIFLSGHPNDTAVMRIMQQCYVALKKQAIIQEFNSCKWQQALDLATTYHASYPEDLDIPGIIERCVEALKISLRVDFNSGKYQEAYDLTVVISNHSHDSEVLKIQQKCVEALKKQSIKKEFDAGKWQETLDLANAFLSKYPNDPEVSSMQRQCRVAVEKKSIEEILNSRNFQDAIKRATAFLSQFPDYENQIESLLNRGKMKEQVLQCFDSKQMEDSLNLAKKFLKEYPNDVEVLDVLNQSQSFVEAKRQVLLLSQSNSVKETLQAAEGFLKTYQDPEVQSMLEASKAKWTLMQQAEKAYKIYSFETAYIVAKTYTEKFGANSRMSEILALSEIALLKENIVYCYHGKQFESACHYGKEYLKHGNDALVQNIVDFCSAIQYRPYIKDVFQFYGIPEAKENELIENYSQDPQLVSILELCQDIRGQLRDLEREKEKKRILNAFSESGSSYTLYSAASRFVTWYGIDHEISAIINAYLSVDQNEN